MRANQREIQRILSADGVIVRSDHPELDSAIAWLARRRQLVPALKGVYVPVASANDPATRIAAVMGTLPDAVLTGDAAAFVSYAPGCAVPEVEVAVSYSRSNPPGFRFHRERVPLDLIIVRGNLRYTNPALTALARSDSLGGAAIDEVLRSRAATLTQLHDALIATRHRRGNCGRRELLLDSRDAPWSELERRFHRILRMLRYTGWKTNYRVVLRGRTYFLDIAFPARRVVIELDGRLVHSDRLTFESDRVRQNQLVLAGWQVLRFTWTMLDDLELVRQTLTAALGNPRAATLIA